MGGGGGGEDEDRGELKVHFVKVLFRNLGENECYWKRLASFLDGRG